MKRTIATVAVLCIVASLGLGYVVGRSAGGDTGDSISSRLDLANSRTAPSTANPPMDGTLATPVESGTPASLATPSPADGSITGTPVSEATTSVAVIAETPLAPETTTPGSATPQPAAMVNAVNVAGNGDLSGDDAPASASAASAGRALPITRSPSFAAPSRPATDGDGIPVRIESPLPPNNL